MRATDTNWLNAKAQAKVKRDLVRILRTTPRAQWANIILAKYSHKPALRVAVFQIFCAMEQSGELDELKGGAQ